MLTPETAARKDRTTGKAEMQHRHFATVATIINEMTVRDESYRYTIAQEFAKGLEDTNPKFDRERFIAACLA